MRSKSHSLAILSLVVVRHLPKNLL